MGTAPQLLVSAPNAIAFDGGSANIQGVMSQAEDNGWVMPHGTFVTFFADSTGTVQYFVTAAAWVSGGSNAGKGRTGSGFASTERTAFRTSLSSGAAPAH